MKIAMTLLLGLALTQPVFAKGADPANGQRLFVNSKCDTAALTGPNPKITSLSELDKAVRSCDVKHNINWFGDEIRDVVSYLDQTYYQFGGS